MSNEKQQSAFPHPKNGGAWGIDPVPGMTLRDYFAAHAPDIPNDFCREIKSEPTVTIHPPDLKGNTKTYGAQPVPESYRSWRARWAYFFADAMMAEREKK